MNRYYTERPAATASYVLGAFALGALAMYLLDPVQGRRRRALIRDQVYSASVKTRKIADAASTDIGNRARGAVAELRKLARGMGVWPEREREFGWPDGPG